MYQFSRAIYRELAPDIDRRSSTPRAASSHAAVLRACEATMERLATDRHYFARPARTLFNDIRIYFPMCAQAHVCSVVTRYIAARRGVLDASRTTATTSAATRCSAARRRARARRASAMPLPHNGYCPSHQHLAETEESARPVARR